MSAGAVFKLIANDGKADRLIMATKLLNQRIKDVMCARKKAGKADFTPTLVDLERTHILFINAHFKPFAAIGYEYNKVKPQSGSPVLGSDITFSIPQFGDFFHDMVCRVVLSSFSSAAQLAPTQPSTNFPANALGPPVINYTLVDPVGTAVAGGAAYSNWVRYCEFPGNRLFQTVKFEVNGNPLDLYTDTVSCFLEKFTVTPNKREGYNRLVGQEVALEGSTGICNGLVNMSGSTGPGFPTPDDVNTPSQLLVDKFGASLGANTYREYARQKLTYVDGPQTPKPTQPALEIWNKLRFWFNDDARLSIPSVSIPFGQRYITISLAAQALLAFEYPGLYLRTLTASLAGGVTSQVVTYNPIYQAGTITTITISAIELYVNNIFVNPEIHDIFIKRIGFTLIRVYRIHTQNVNTSTDDKQLSQLKWPVEYIFLGLRPSWNVRSTNQWQWRDWHRMHKVVTSVCADATLAEVNTGAAAAASTATSSVGSIDPKNFYVPLLTIDSVTVTAHGISIFDNFNAPFFSAYMPYHYGGASLVTPTDPGALFINFALFPRSYQPSGHMNISRAREFFVKYVSRYVTSTTPADLLAVAVCINFLLVTDGSAVLRYAT